MSLAAIDSEFAEAIRARTFSAAQVLVAHGDQILFTRAYGTLRYPPAPEANEATLFDIASLTKIVATTLVSMLAVESGRLQLHAPVREYLPRFDRSEAITIRHLLAHNSGLPAWLPLFQETIGKGWGAESIREYFIERINSTPLSQAPGIKRVYSDLGFILLGFLLEKIYASDLAALFEDSLAAPLGLRETFFHPLRRIGAESPNIAATETCPWRGKTLQGEVHDDNAFVMGGAAGHAGLFSTARDLHHFTSFLLEAEAGKSKLLGARTFREFLEGEDGFRLGWDSVSLPKSQAGRYFSQRTIGHLGFTGCSYWLDLEDEKSIILLTNRVHPRRDHEAIKEFRPRIHDLLAETFLS